MDLLPEGFSFRERFQMAREAGFRSVEMHTVVDPDEAERVRNAAEETGVHVHSVLVKDGRVPFFAGGAEEIERAVHLTLRSLANAARCGSDALLLIPAVVTKTISHREGYETSLQAVGHTGYVTNTGIPRAPRSGGWTRCTVSCTASGSRRSRAERTAS